jgi:hypothetical protein
MHTRKMLHLIILGIILKCIQNLLFIVNVIGVLLAEFPLAALENTVCDDKLGFFLDFVTSILFRDPLI